MKGLAIALTIISFLAAPQVMARDSQAPFHSQAMFHSQGDDHKSEQGELHDKEAWDINESNEESPEPSETPEATPTSTPTGTATPTATPTPIETATPTASPIETITPTESPTPTGSPIAITATETLSINDLINQMIAFFQSLLK